MIDAHLDSERLPAVAHGLARWSPEEAAHLEHCAECRLEWNLVWAARQLGRVPAERIVPSRSAAAVVRRLGEEPVAPGATSRKPARWILGLAAAAAITLAVLLPSGEPPAARSPAGDEIAVLHELDGLTSAELEVVLETIPLAADEALHVEAAPLGELSATDLEHMLQSME